MVDIQAYLETRGHQFTCSQHPQTTCPFHAESRPSFTVYEDGHWHCYGCQKHGDILSLRWRLEAPDMPFSIWQEYQPVVPTYSHKVARLLSRQPTPTQLKIMTLAAEHYAQCLTDEARAYLYRRRVTRPERFGIGYAPDTAIAFLHLVSQMKALGDLWHLAARSVNLITPTGRERLRHRIIVPQRAARLNIQANNAVIYFQARSLSNCDRRYLNPPSLERPLFGDVTLPGPIVVSEGVFDILPLIERGIPALALLGTDRSTVKKLQPYADRELILCLDNDSPGERCAGLIQRHLPHTRIVRPPIDDLGHWIEEQGTEIVIDQLLNSRSRITSI